MKTVGRVLSYVVVLAVGFGGGTYVGYAASQARASAYQMAEIAHYSAFVSAQMSEGTDEAGEEALRVFLAVIENRKGNWSPIFPERVYAIDSALTNARLSALAQRRGARDEARRYLDAALSFCPQTGWRDCTAENMMAVVQRLDKDGIFGLNKAAGAP